jgi:hypothetical protein
MPKTSTSQEVLLPEVARGVRLVVFPATGPFVKLTRTMTKLGTTDAESARGTPNERVLTMNRYNDSDRDDSQR